MMPMTYPNVSTSDPAADLGPLHWAPPASAPAPRGRKSRRWVAPTLLVVATLLVAGLLASSFVTIPYYAIAPGSARRVDDLVRVSDQSKVYPHKGDVLFTTVSEYRARVIDAVHSWFDHDIQLIGEKRILGDAQPNQLNQINLQEMTDSKQVAVAVALRRIGVQEQGSGTVITSVGEQVPATGHLRQGDVIVAVDGKPTNLSQDAVDLI